MPVKSSCYRNDLPTYLTLETLLFLQILYINWWRREAWRKVESRSRIGRENVEARRNVEFEKVILLFSNRFVAPM